MREFGRVIGPFVLILVSHLKGEFEYVGSEMGPDSMSYGRREWVWKHGWTAVSDEWNSSRQFGIVGSARRWVGQRR